MVDRVDVGSLAPLREGSDSSPAEPDYHALGFDKPVGLRHVSLWGRITYSFVAPFIDKGWTHELVEKTALALPSKPLDSRFLANLVTQKYEDEAKAREEDSGANIIRGALLRSSWPWMLLHLSWGLCEMSLRLVQPFLLRGFLLWLEDYRSEEGAELADGWMWVSLMSLAVILMVLVHHSMFWIGYCLGVKARQQAVSAVQAKVLRLNTAVISDVTTGKVVNLVSNDVWRFDLFGFFWLFVLIGPLELIIVFILVSLELGVLPALAGVSILLAVIPVQAYLSKTISRLRLGTTDRTDDRVKLCSEAITGALAMKFLGWERYFLEAVTRVRAQEQSFSILRARIVSASMGLQFAVTPLVSFITFAVVRARGDNLDLASTFYAVTLLHLPKLYMCTFFVKGAQALAELNISLKRLDGFLKLPEPPPPASHQHPPAQPAPENRHANDNARLHSPFGDADGVPPSSESDDVNYEQLGWVAMRGADFCWQSRAWAGMADKKLVEGGGKPGEAGGKGRGGGWQPWARPAPSPARQISRVGTLPLARLNSAAAGGEAGGKPEPGVPAKPQDGAPTRTHDAIVEAAVEEEEEEAGSGTPLMALRAPQFRVRPGQLVAVVGQVGSGKSSLLAALLGELQPVPPPGWSGTFPSPGAPVVTGKVAYCQQVPWIKAGTVRENILFGQAMEEERFWAVVDACALRQDIEELPGGIEAELGERGINLSGGQKARVALARAAYAQADVQLLDDPLSAVDSRVGQTLFKHCIGPGGLMKDSTRILVTHHLTFLSQCDRILVLRRGQVVHDGTYAELQPLDLPELSAPAASLDAEEPDPPAPETAAASEELGRGLSAESAGSSSESVAGSGDACKRDGPVGIGEKGELDAAVPRMTDKNEKTAATASGQAGRLVKEEDREKGGVKMNVYMEYIRYCGVVPMLMVGVLLVIGQVAFVYSEIWLASWSQSDDQSNAKWLAVYGGLTAFIVAVSFVRSFTFFDCTFKGASRLHLKAVQVVLRAPLSFFHTNPTGRILNRFSKDQGQVDEMLPQNAFDFLQTGGGVVGALVIVAISTPHILPVFFLLLLVFLRLRLRYLTSSRDIKRFEATTRSPVYASFSSTLKGLSTIRAFQAMDQVRRRFLEELHLNGSWWVAFLCAARWVGFRMDCISMVVQVAAVVLAILLRDSVSEDVVAVSLTQVLQLGGVLQWCVRQSAEMENDMTSTERLVEYTHLPQEAPLAEDAPVHPPPKWPTSGALQYEKVTASYRAGLPPVLRDLSFSIPAGATCGIVGRTGCGKSSLILTLFRLINVDSGTITLDGMDTGKVGIDRLRQHLAIIPQDPVLFSGTLRSNLDPEELHTDQQLWEVLKMVALDDSIQGMGGLLVQMGEAGETLSAGQRQLFCLARVLLQDACLLALDEATANVDRRTDARIQDTLRQFLRSPGNAFPRSSTASRRRSGPGSERPWRRSGQFSSLQHGDQPHRLPEGGPAKGEKGWRTLLVVAHRLETIMDCDIVLVLSEGRLVEAGPPSELQDQPGGTFAAMCAAATASGVQLRRATPGTGSPATT